MSVTTVTRFHAAEGQEATLLELQYEGRQRMLAAEGCDAQGEHAGCEREAPQFPGHRRFYYRRKLDACAGSGAAPWPGVA